MNYSVSNFGRIRNDVTGKVRTPQCRYKCSGHLSTHIQGKNYSYSRMVAIHFVPNPEGHPIVRHFDGNDQNNHYSNLVWGTQKDNIDDSFRHGTHTSLDCEGYKKQQNETGKPSKVKRKKKYDLPMGIQMKVQVKSTKYLAYLNSESQGAKYLGTFTTLEEAVQVHRDAYYERYGVYPS